MFFLVSQIILGDTIYQHHKVTKNDFSEKLFSSDFKLYFKSQLQNIFHQQYLPLLISSIAKIKTENQIKLPTSICWKNCTQNSLIIGYMSFHITYCLDISNSLKITVICF